MLSDSWMEAGVMVHIIAVFEFPPRAFFKSRVSLESRVVTCCKLKSEKKNVNISSKGLALKIVQTYSTPFTQLLQTRVCFTNAGINTYGAEIHKVRKTCNSRISIVPISNITFQTLCKRAFLRNNGASKQ